MHSAWQNTLQDRQLYTAPQEKKTFPVVGIEPGSFALRRRCLFNWVITTTSTQNTILKRNFLGLAAGVQRTATLWRTMGTQRSQGLTVHVYSHHCKKERVNDDFFFDLRKAIMSSLNLTIKHNPQRSLHALILALTLSTLPFASHARKLRV